MNKDVHVFAFCIIIFRNHFKIIFIDHEAWHQIDSETLQMFRSRGKLFKSFEIFMIKVILKKKKIEEESLHCIVLISWIYKKEFYNFNLF